MPDITERCRQPGRAVPRILSTVALAVALLCLVGCADLHQPAQPAVSQAPKTPPTAEVVYFRDETVSTGDSVVSAETDLRAAVIPVAVQRRAILKVFPLNGSSFASGVAAGEADFSHLSDNPDKRSLQVNTEISALFADLRNPGAVSVVTDVVGVFREAAAIRSSLGPGGHLLIAVGGDAVPTTPACDSQWAPTDPGAADTFALACLGDSSADDSSVEFWFLSAGQSMTGRFSDDETVSTREDLSALVRHTHGLLCPFQADPIAPGTCH